MNTKKSRQMNEPLEKKLVSCLPAVGPALAKNLTAQGFEYGEDIYQVFLKYKGRKKKFQKWMKVIANAQNSQSSTIYESLYRYDQEFGEIESKSKVPEQKKGTKRSLKEYAQKTGGTAKNKTVQFKKAKVDEKTAANDSADSTDTDSTLILQHTVPKKGENVTKSDPITSFFLSTLETVKTFPRSLQVQVKRQFFKIMIDAEDSLVGNESEPVASTSFCTPGCSFQPQSSTPVVNNFQQENTASSTPVLNNFQRDNTASSTPVLNNFHRDNEASSTPALNNVQQDNTATSTPVLNNIQQHNIAISRPELNNFPRDNTATSNPVLNNFRQENTATSMPVLNNLQQNNTGTSIPVVNNFQQDNITTPASVVNNFRQDNTATTAPVINNSRQDNAAASMPVLNNFQQDNIDSPTPTVVNGFSIKQEKLDDNPEATTSQVQPIFANNNGYRVSTYETIVLD